MIDAGIDLRDDLSFLVLHVEAAVADGEIELPVGPEFQPVHVVPAKGEVHAEAAQQLLLHLGLAAVFLVLEVPEIRDAGVPNVVAAREDAGAGAIERIHEAVGEDDALVRLAVALGILEADDAILEGGELVREPLLVRVELVHHRQAVVVVLRGDVVAQPVGVRAVVLDPALLPIRLGDVPAALFILRKRDGILQQRLGGEELRLELAVELEPLDRIRRRVGAARPGGRGRRARRRHGRGRNDDRQQGGDKGGGGTGTHGKKERTARKRRRACNASPPTGQPPPVRDMGRKERKEGIFGVIRSKRHGAAPPRGVPRPRNHTRLRARTSACWAMTSAARAAGSMNESRMAWRRKPSCSSRSFCHCKCPASAW